MNSAISKLGRSWMIVFLVAAAIARSAVPVRAAVGVTITVTTNNDALANDGVCSLREAITAANSGSPSTDSSGTPCAAGTGDDEIVFAGNYTITLGSQLPAVTTTMIITGNGAANTIVQANASPNTATYRVFRIDAGGTLTLDGVTVRHGRCNGSCEGSTHLGGGIIVNGGVLHLVNSTLSGNTASGGDYASGGGIGATTATVEILNSTLANNTAVKGGGIYQTLGTTTITDSSFNANSAGGGSNNPSGSGDGGAIYNLSGGLTISGSTFDTNTASGDWTGIGAALYTHSDGAAVSVSDSNFYNNNGPMGTVFVYQGGLNISGSTFHNNGDIAIRGSVLGMALTIINSTFSASSTTNASVAAAIWSSSASDTVTVVNSTISGSLTGYGLGIAAGDLTLRNSILANGTGTYDCVFGVGGTLTENNNLIESNDGCGTPVSTTDPNLGLLANNGGPTQTMALLPLSPAIDAGSSSVPTSEDQRGVLRPQGPRYDIGAFELEQTAVLFRSLGTQDGWVLESTENSGSGGSSNSTATELNLGDDASDRQYRAILSFNTGPTLPDTAVITSATLKLKKTGTVGGSNPFGSLGSLIADIKAGPFSGNAALQLTDFKALAGKNYVAKYSSAATTWISGPIGSAGLPYINRTGGTQIRLRFYKDDNDNSIANYLKFATGNAITTSRPQLVITYYVP